MVVAPPDRLSRRGGSGPNSGVTVAPLPSGPPPSPFPFAAAAALAARRRARRLWRGGWRSYHVAPWGPYYIWGATARVLLALAKRLSA